MIYEENQLQYHDYYSIRESVGWLHFSEEQTRRALEKSLYDIVAVEDTQVVGMGRLIGDGLYYVIVDLAVRPEYQGKKIGTQIVTKLLEYIESHIPIDGRASVQLIAEKGKESFYEKLGFKTIPHEHCGTGMRKVIHHREGI